jgi:hypothetical protein
MIFCNRSKTHRVSNADAGIRPLAKGGFMQNRSGKVGEVCHGVPRPKAGYGLR